MGPARSETSLAASRPEAHTDRPYPYRVIMPDVPMSIEKTETRLMNKAVHYLGRYSASEQRLREVLGRFAKRKLADTEPAELASVTNNVVEKCLRLGYIDDAAFAANQARGQRRQGKSTLAIRQRLRQHALDDAAITMALQTADANHQDAEMMAAIHFARRRRLGPFFNGVPDERTRHRHMGSLARAGFSMAICRTVFDTNSIDDLEELERDAGQSGRPDE